MATEKKFFYVARQNQVRDSKMFGKWYPEAYVLQTLSTRALAKHIQKHGSPYTLDVIMGVLIAFARASTCASRPRAATSRARTSPAARC